MKRPNALSALGDEARLPTIGGAGLCTQSAGMHPAYYASARRTIAIVVNSGMVNRT